MFNKDVETKKKRTIKNNTKKTNKKVKSIKNTVSPGDPCTNFFHDQDCVLDADINKKQNKLPRLNLALILNYIA